MSAPVGETMEEPNLTPMLDMVLQLVMFFMLCANFAMEQVNENIKLPTAQSAKPMDKTESAVLFLNVLKDGKVGMLGRESIGSEAELMSVLKNEMKDYQREATRLNRKDKSMIVIIRADRETNYEDVYKAMRAAKSSGFQKIQLRAIMGGGV